MAIPGSPRPQSFTDKMLSLFLEGMGESTEVHKLYPHRMNVKPCTGCWTCWFKTPGKCAQHDDMEQILPRLAEADVIILASPLYHGGLNGLVKTFLDRTIPLVKCDIITDGEGHSRHPR